MKLQGSAPERWRRGWGRCQEHRPPPPHPQGSTCECHPVGSAVGFPGTNPNRPSPLCLPKSRRCPFWALVPTQTNLPPFRSRSGRRPEGFPANPNKAPPFCETQLLHIAVGTRNGGRKPGADSGNHHFSGGSLEKHQLVSCVYVSVFVCVCVFV